MDDLSGQFLCLYQNYARLLYIAIRLDTPRVVFQMVIQGMYESKSSQTLNNL